MGSSSFNPTDWDTHTTRTAGKPMASIFSRGAIKSNPDPKLSFDPLTIPFRESRDSTVNPNSTPIAIFLDVTGSMHDIPLYMIKTGLGPIFQEIYDRKPVTDPHILFGAVGDVVCDSAPLQVTQFEADICLAEQLSQIYLEGGGGGNSNESYSLPWYWADQHTKCDRIEKGRGKGILFTIGDEELPPTITTSQIKKFLGDDITEDIKSSDLYDRVSKTWEIFHIVIKQGSHYRGSPSAVEKSWKKVLGQHLIMLDDYTKLAPVIVSTLQILGGEDPDKVAASWDGSTALAVRNATKSLSVGGKSSLPVTGKGVVSL